MRRPDSPVEHFRFVTAATTRSLANDGELDVQFGPSQASLTGNTLTLPTPGSRIDSEEAARIRGEADAVALRRRHHDPRVHRARAPVDEDARAVFDAFEQVRCETLGSQFMAGVRRNLGAALENHCQSRGYAEIVQGEHAPLPEVLRLLARETLTGEGPPPSARRMVELWRPNPRAQDRVEPGRAVESRFRPARVREALARASAGARPGGGRRPPRGRQRQRRTG